MSDISFHFFRTHFAENKRWLQFVVREGDIYFQIYSWRGKGSQMETFMNLFQKLQVLLERAHEQMLMPIHPSSKYPTEIVSKDEFTLIGPFTARLKGFIARQRNYSSAGLKYNSSQLGRADQVGSRFTSLNALSARHKPKKTVHSFSSTKRALENRGWASEDGGESASSICEEQIEMVDYDSLLRHFKYEKRLGAPIMPGELKNKENDLASEIVRKA